MIFLFKKVLSLLSAFVITLCAAPAQAAQSKKEYDSFEALLDDCEAQHIAVFEAGTGTMLCEKNGGGKVSVSHLTKLMTALVVYDFVSAGEVDMGDSFRTSSYANSMQGTQIWLDIGEEITVGELVRAITVSNANDAAVVLAEGCAGSEERFVRLMNKRAAGLGMNDTKFSDCTGVSDKNISTAKDMAILTAELMKKNVFSQEYTTRMCEVGRKGSQLVTQNRLVDNFKGIKGYKALTSESNGEMLVTGAKQRDLEVCAVLLGGKDDDKKFADAKSVMNYAFTHFEVYYPEIPDDACEDAAVSHGQEGSVALEVKCKNIIIERGTYRQIYTKLTRKEALEAPVKKGDKAGQIVFYNDDGEILALDITAACDVKEMDYLFALKSMLCNLFNIV